MSETPEIEFRAYEHTEQLNEFAAALAKAQGTIEGAKKDSENPHFKSKYADLASVWEACRKALSANSMAVVQMPAMTHHGDVTVTTQLLHASGQWMRSTVAAKPVKADAQGVGSVITYLRRYSLAAMVGVAPEDDDAEGGSGRGNGNGESIRPNARPQARTAAPRQSESDTAFRQLANDILGGIKACETREALNTLLKVRADDLMSVKNASQTAYEALMDNANKKDVTFTDHTELSAA